MGTLGSTKKSVTNTGSGSSAVAEMVLAPLGLAPVGFSFVGLGVELTRFLRGADVTPGPMAPDVTPDVAIGSVVSQVRASQQDAQAR